jgi:hypothetical protein
MWEECRGPIPAGLQVMHTCDVRACINPAHLELGTQSKNMRDAYARDRHPGNGDQRGERHPRAKLSVLDVEAIRVRAQRGESHTAIARDYPVVRSHISLIVRRRSWSHL